MKHALLLFTALTFFSAAVMAQPVETVPLGPVPYTLKNETDPMALDSSGADTPHLESETIAPSPSYAPIGQPQDIPPPAPIMDDTAPPRNATQYSPNNNVSGVPVRDTSKFEKMVFCTIEIAFGSFGTGTDQKTGAAVKTYLDGNADKLTYTRTDMGKEGEYAYCIMIADRTNQSKIYSDLKRMLPRPTRNTPPITLTGRSFTPVSTLKKDYGNN